MGLERCAGKVVWFARAMEALKILGRRGISEYSLGSERNLGERGEEASRDSTLVVPARTGEELGKRKALEGWGKALSPMLVVGSPPETYSMRGPWGLHGGAVCMVGVAPEQKHSNRQSPGKAPPVVCCCFWKWRFNPGVL